MGEVFSARRVSDGKVVAIKRILPEIGQDRQGEFQRRFIREINISKRLAHPYVVQVLDGGRLGQCGSPFLVMEFLHGSALDDYIDSETISDKMTRRVLACMAEALSYLHHQGYIHRDIKPGNVFLEKSGRVVLLDFGLTFDHKQTRMTATNCQVGTYFTLSPEALAGGPVTPAWDVYALGVTLYFALMGRWPFSSEQIVDLAIGKHLKPPSIRLERPDISPALRSIIKGCMALDPAKRFRNGQELLAAYESIVSELEAAVYSQKFVSDKPESSATTANTAFQQDSLTTTITVSRTRRLSFACVVVLSLILVIGMGLHSFAPIQQTDHPSLSTIRRETRELLDHISLGTEHVDDKTLRSLGIAIQDTGLGKRAGIGPCNCPETLALYFISKQSQDKLKPLLRIIEYFDPLAIHLEKGGSVPQVLEDSLTAAIDTASVPALRKALKLRRKHTRDLTQLWIEIFYAHTLLEPVRATPADKAVFGTMADFQGAAHILEKVIKEEGDMHPQLERALSLYFHALSGIKTEAAFGRVLAILNILDTPRYRHRVKWHDLCIKATLTVSGALESGKRSVTLVEQMMPWMDLAHDRARSSRERAHINLVKARALETIDRHTDALEILDRIQAEQLPPKVRWELGLARGDASRNLQRFGEARSAYAASLRHCSKGKSRTLEQRLEQLVTEEALLGFRR